jgi:hypothetical protein
MDWSAHSVTLLRLYGSHVRAKLDYACVVSGSVRPSYLAPLGQVRNAALRVFLGAFRTSPIPSFHVEAGEMSLNLRRHELCLQFDEAESVNRPINQYSFNWQLPNCHCKQTNAQSKLHDVKVTDKSEV